MENLKVIEIVLHKIDIISNEQMRIFRYNDELDDRRLRLMEFIQRGENLEIAPGEGQSHRKCHRNEIKCVKI